MKSIFGLLLILFFGGFSSNSASAVESSRALVPVKVEVQDPNRASPFNRERLLNVPEGARISVLARVKKARFLAVSPSGDVLVSQPSGGKIFLLRRSGASETKP